MARFSLSILLWAASLKFAIVSGQDGQDLADSVTEVIAPENTTYLGFERVQLTDAGLANLNANTAALFAFDNDPFSFDNSTDLAHGDTSCRVYPGDLLFPATIIWELFNRILGGNALIKTIPLASPCYAGILYDAAKCAALTANWTSSYLQ
jgi:hypothetical protein